MVIQADRYFQYSDGSTKYINSGLTNSGRICYADAYLQVIVSLPFLPPCLRTSPDTRKQHYGLYYAFATVIRPLVGGSRIPINPTNFMRKFHQQYPFSSGEQRMQYCHGIFALLLFTYCCDFVINILHYPSLCSSHGTTDDSQEFGIKLRESILKEIQGLENGSKDDQQVFQEMNQFYNNFGSGFRRDVATCSNCNNIRDVIADFTEIELYFPESYHNPSTNQIKQTESIQVTNMMNECIYNMELSDRDCEAFNVRSTTTQIRSTIRANPKRLILYIQRQMSDPNYQTNKSVFINSRVKFSMNIFRLTSNHDADGQNIVYDLFATINHHPTKESRTKHFGHHTAQCKYPNTALSPFSPPRDSTTREEHASHGG